jgi:ribosome maturation factor RimP
MALTEKVSVDQITVLEDGQIQVRQVTRILDDGEEIAHTYHRHVVSPGDDLTGEDPRVKAHGKIAHTAAVVAAYKEARAARQAEE